MTNRIVFAMVSIALSMLLIAADAAPQPAKDVDKLIETVITRPDSDGAKVALASLRAADKERLVKLVPKYLRDDKTRESALAFLKQCPIPGIFSSIKGIEKEKLSSAAWQACVHYEEAASWLYTQWQAAEGEKRAELTAILMDAALTSSEIRRLGAEVEKGNSDAAKILSHKLEMTETTTDDVKAAWKKAHKELDVAFKGKKGKGTDLLESLTWSGGRFIRMGNSLYIPRGATITSEAFPDWVHEKEYTFSMNFWVPKEGDNAYMQINGGFTSATEFTVHRVTVSGEKLDLNITEKSAGSTIKRKTWQQLDVVLHDADKHEDKAQRLTLTKVNGEDMENSSMLIRQHARAISFSGGESGLIVSGLVVNGK